MKWVHKKIGNGALPALLDGETHVTPPDRVLERRAQENARKSEMALKDNANAREALDQIRTVERIARDRR